MINPKSHQYAEMKRKMAQMGLSNAAAADIPFPSAHELEAHKSSKSCRDNNKWGLYEYPLSMVYSPYQVWRNIYSEDNALMRGTLFAELDLPFEGCDK